MICGGKTLRLITSSVRLYFNHNSPMDQSKRVLYSVHCTINNIVNRNISCYMKGIAFILKK